MKTCSVTCTGNSMTCTGNSMTSRVRWVQPPDRWVAAIGTALHHVLHPMGRCHARAGEAVASLLSGLLLRWGLAARFRLEAGHSGRVVRFRLALQFGNPPLQPLNHPLLFQNGGLQLGNDGDEEIAVGGGQVTLSIHSLYMT